MIEGKGLFYLFVTNAITQTQVTIRIHDVTVIKFTEEICNIAELMDIRIITFIGREGMIGKQGTVS